jgi:proteasome lid subunit RPN8/RPN11
MIYSIRASIREHVAPDHRLSCSSRLWRALLHELARRGGGHRESGAFLLGKRLGDRSAARSFICYDDLDPHCLDNGIVVFDGNGYGPLWQHCRKAQLEVVADVHTHGGPARQSGADRDHPMIATPGHIALIVPGFAQRLVGARELGVYEYLGEHRWQSYYEKAAGRFFYIGLWG